MPPILKTRQILSDMLRDRLIQHATKHNTSILLFKPTNIIEEKYPFTPHLGAPLDDSGNPISSLFLHKWEGQDVHSIRYPCLLAVVEGEIDWRIGVTQSTAQKHGGELTNCDYFVLPIKEGDFCLIPPGVPYSMGVPHWERSVPQENSGTLFWMVAFPSGVLCHYCRSVAGEHTHGSQIFVPSPRAHQLIRMLMEELYAKRKSTLIIEAHLQAILGYIYRGLQASSQAGHLEVEATLQLKNSATPHPQTPQKRAKDYIEANLQFPLTAKLIASHAYISVRQLDRQFHRSDGKSLMGYVQTRRIARAKVLLRDTDLPIGEIGKLVGYRNPSSFTQIFKRCCKISPRMFRKSLKK